jgi:hypothetical protein
MKSEDRLAELFRRYSQAVQNETEEEALRVRKLIQLERERQDKK